MILTSTTEIVRFTPAWLDGKPDAPVFLLRAGGVIERAQMEAELAGPHQAGKVYGFELREAIRNGVLTLLADDPELDRVLGVLDAEAEALAEEAKGNTPQPIPADDQLLLAEIRKVLVANWPEYRDLVAQLERRREIAPIVALRRFCTGIEAKGVTFARAPDGLVSEATLASLEPLEMLAAGNRAFAMLFGGGQERNFPQPSASDNSQQSSSSEPSKAGGSSARKGGRKTRA